MKSIIFFNSIYFLLIITVSFRFSISSEVESLNADNYLDENRETFTENEEENSEIEYNEKSVAVSSENKTILLANETESANNDSSRFATESISFANASNNSSTNANNISSPLPTVLPSSQPSTSTSLTPVPVTDTPTSSPPLRWKHDLLCLCDLHMKACDWNCCCDDDCSKDDKLVFSTCEGSQLYDPKDPGQRENSCFRSYVFYTHNNPSLLERSKSGLFCIVTDNNLEETELEIPRDALENRIRKARPKYLWSSQRRELLSILSKSYKYGSIIWGTKQKTHSEKRERFPFSLPAAYQGKLCSLNEPVKFLQDSQTSCTVLTPNLEKACSSFKRLNANNYIEDSFIVRNPSEIDAESEIEIRKAICNIQNQNESKCKEATKIPSPVMNNSPLVCKNILQKMNITIVHNGMKGVVDVIVKVELKDFPVSTKEILQEFRVNFVWKEKDKVNVSKEIDINVSDWPRSGNPGYIIGKPVIMGEKVQEIDSSNNENYNNENENKGQNISSPEEIKNGNDYIKLKIPSQWMTVLSPGDCDLHFDHPKRRSVLFGLSHSSSCRVKSAAQKYCVDLQLMIGRILLGVEHPENFMKLHKYVAAFGNPDPSSLSEWVPIDLENYGFNMLPKSRAERPPNSQLVSSGCDNIVSMLHIQIAFAHVGSVDFPQAKILKVMYEFGESYSIPKKLPCKTNCNKDSGLDINVKTVVTFIDTTTRPITKVAKWPIVSIKLPSDFFYPFSSPSLSSASKIINFYGAVHLIVSSSLFVGFVSNFIS